MRFSLSFLPKLLYFLSPQSPREVNLLFTIGVGTVTRPEYLRDISAISPQCQLATALHLILICFLLNVFWLKNHLPDSGCSVEETQCFAERVKADFEETVKAIFNKAMREGLPSLFAPIMIATLSTCAQLERDNISFRLLSGRKRYIEKGGKLGRKVGSVKTEEQMKAEYREVISLLRKGYSIRDVAKLSGKGVSTVQRVKRLIKVQSSQ